MVDECTTNHYHSLYNFNSRGTPMIDTFDPNDIEKSWHGISLTPSAAKQIAQLVSSEPAIIGLKLAVKKSGCAGFAYDMSLTKETSSDDLVYESHGSKVVVPMGSMAHLDGTEVDFVSEGINRVFKFNNPRATSACGCGESFSADNEIGSI